MHSIRTRCETCEVRRSGVCSALDDEALAQLFQLSRRKAVPAHTVIFRDGDEADQYFNITSGIVKLVKTLADGHQHIIGLIYRPDFMGQTLNPHHTYSAESATDVELCAFPRAAFDAFLRTHPELERQIFETTIRELDVCRDWTLLLGRKCSYERVAGFLLMLARRVPKSGAGEAGENSVRFELPFTRAEMADYLGLTLETVSRQFSLLKKKRVIGLPSSRDITIPDLELLSAIAQLESCSTALEESQSRAIA
jgi:CRP/FNR family transcriptional regulator, anaerobic regulatory protein